MQKILPFVSRCISSSSKKWALPSLLIVAKRLRIHTQLHKTRRILCKILSFWSKFFWKSVMSISTSSLCVKNGICRHVQCKRERWKLIHIAEQKNGTRNPILGLLAITHPQKAEHDLILRKCLLSLSKCIRRSFVSYNLLPLLNRPVSPILIIWITNIDTIL